MSAPTRYNLTYDFTGFQSANPNSPLPADKLEIEFQNLATTTGETITNLGLIQRSDGKLQNGIVEFDSLSSATKALLGTTINPRGDWAANTAYKVLDMVTVGETTYIAVVDHASGTSFTVDLTANKWQLWANPGFVDGTSFFQKFSGNGSQTAFTVSQDMGTDENGLLIFINNSGWIPQDPANFTISGTTLTFLAAPPNGTNNIFVFAPAKILSQAAAYAAAAGTSAAGAATSASSASSSASTASTAATNAGNSATAAAASASAASTSATNAASSASAASTSASNASTSATNAASSASSASTSASNASTSATAAAASASTASSAATTASTSATNAGNSATAAATSATNAASSATAAAASATAAAASAASVPQHTFNKTTDPTVSDDSSDGYSVGSIWVNTVNDIAYMAVDVTVDAAIWQIVGSVGGDTMVFQPANKFSPVRMQSYHGWANGNRDDGAAAKHDASAGAVPSFTSAKKGSVCIVTVAGTLNGVSVGVGDLLQARKNKPTLATDWAVLKDCSTEWNTMVDLADGAEILLNGTFLIEKGNSGRKPINISPLSKATILNRCGVPAIWTTDNDGFEATSPTTVSVDTTSIGASVSFTITNPSSYDFKVGEFASARSTSSRSIGFMITGYAGGIVTGTVLYKNGTGSGTSWTVRSGGAYGATMVKCASAGAGIGVAIDSDDEAGGKLGEATYLQMETAGHENYFTLMRKVQVFTNAVHVADTGVNFMAVGMVASVDTTNHRVYLERKVEYQNQIANASQIYLIALPENQQVNIPNKDSITLMGAPTIIGKSVGWWLDLFGDTDETATISVVEGGKRRLTFSETPNYKVNQCIHLMGLTGGTDSNGNVQDETPRRVLAVDTGTNVVDIEITDDTYASKTSGVTDSYSIGTGSKTFNLGTYSSASSAPKFAVDQLVDIVSTANAANAMFGLVTAYDTTNYATTGVVLTVNVTSVIGSGTIADWKIYAPSADTAIWINVPVSGSVSFRAGFWSSEFDSTSHGGALVAQHAHGSNINCHVSRLWSSGVRDRFSHFNDGDVECDVKMSHRGTAFNGKSWNLAYMRDKYASCFGRNKIIGTTTRHDTTGGSAGSSSTWEPHFWVSRSGMALNIDVVTESINCLGATGDTHAHQKGARIRSKAKYPTATNTAHTYRYIGAQLRSEDEIRDHEQIGGQIGLRIANGSSYVREPGSVDRIKLRTFDMPVRSDTHTFQLNTSGTPIGATGNLTCGFIMQSQASYTGGADGDRTLMTGDFDMSRSGCGFIYENNNKARLSNAVHMTVGYAGGWLKAGTDVYAADMTLDYSIGNGVETTSSTSHTLAAGVGQLTVATGLNIKAGQDLLIQDNTGASSNVRRANYEWGRVTGYDSGTGVLDFYVDGVKGSKSSGTAWRVTVGASIPRFGVVMSSDAKFSFGTMKVNIGLGANPDEIFFNYDTSGVKTVRGGVLEINDPNNYGMPVISRAGADAYFDVQIGVIIYNGKVINSIGTGSIVGNFDGGGTVIPTNKKCRVRMPYAGTISKWYVDADQSGSIVVDVKKNGTSLVGGGGNKPTLSTAQNANAVPASWTGVVFAKGDLIEFNVDSVTTLTQATVTLEVQKV